MRRGARHPVRRARRGFTLVELVVSISVGGVISLAAGLLLLEATEVLAASTARNTLTDRTARALEQVLRELREIEPTAPLGSTADISSASATAIEFDGRGIRKNGTALEMTLDGGASWHRSAENVSALTLAYYDAAGSALTALPLSSGDRAAVRQIGVEIEATSSGETLRMRSRVYLRNFMGEAP